MKLRFLAIIAISTLVLSCKNEKQVEPEAAPQAEQPVANNRFRVILDVTVKKDDNLQVYYNTGKGFNEEEAVWAAVKGMPDSQKVVFELPDEVIPLSLRIDLGVKEDQQDIIFSGFEMSYSGKTFESRGYEIGKYFYPLEGTEADFTSGVVKVKLKDGKRVEPAFNPIDENLSVEIGNITK
jgi:hypothetical protein